MKAILNFLKSAEESLALEFLELFSQNKQQLNQINMKLTDLASAFTALDTQVTTIAASVATLQATLTNVDLPADAQAALDKLTADVGSLSTEVAPAAQS